ncbi:HAMP domain-containing protein [Nocardioides sp. dk4132]|uniref:sensor histidine kinase n=1 Tax=unclassified Nocardioides TaxID=2615069 RepID=UPI0012956653|nr:MULTISPECIES: HAMP domain-containing sensor histidine kinase [unclassified Nocardioides]MQW76042.1 HAMP domain-containing protein [Nocardioides sp. dk4132]QGA08892.1 HAMP domain-containing protein [Nocardioides sp. dk884]
MRRFRSLTARLVLTAVALVAVVTALVATVTTLAMHDRLNDQVDAQVREALISATRTPPGAPLGIDPRNQAPGTVVLVLSDDGSSESAVLGDAPGTRRELDESQVEALEEVPADGRPRAVDLDGLGGYRAAALDLDRGTLVLGLPTADADDAVASLIGWEAALVLLGVAAAAGVGLVVVRRQLRPLTEVAHTAHEVAALPLASGEVDLSTRVPARLTDDHTEVGQVGAALNTLLAHVESALDARHRSEQQVRQFVADASHELRTPLATIAGYTELARRRPDDPEATRTALAKVEEESARMTSLVEDLLLLARLDAGRPLERERVDLTLLLLEAVSDARVLAPDHHWRLDLPEDSVEVLGDAQRLHQVVTNLLSNARTHTPAGTTVTVSARPDGFSVHDDGPGFAPDLAEHAFERFVRGDASRQRSGGSGLGLALVRAILAAQGGSVELRSTPGDTTLRVTLRPAT